MIKDHKRLDTSIIGKRFGFLTVVEFSHFGNSRNSYWKCICDCGVETIKMRGGLVSGDIVSCGCYHRMRQKQARKHGLCSTKLYSTWSGMVQRCSNSNAEQKKG